MKKKIIKNEIIIYQAKSGAIELKGDFNKETVWATQAQIADIFEINRTVVTKHIGNIFKSKEVESKSNVQKVHIANSDKPVAFYSLDIILAIGYRTNSVKAIRFRKWATSVLRKHLVVGYTINRSRIAKNYDEFLKAVEQVKKVLPDGGVVDAKNALELIKMFADTWFSLDAFDKSKLPKSGITKKQVNFTATEITKALRELKQELISKKETTDMFGMERENDSIASIMGNVFQTFDGKDVYPSVEEKAAHLLYFMVKNHPFVDGNKRSGAFAFVWFLKKVNLLNTSRLTPTALTALTLLVAESKPKDKEQIVGLILILLKK
ncbi:death-on-curing protein [bacterium CG_4_8_14_3_um_filter_33_28]|nr:MAG: death-on-curing protein [bacterium CG_4_8_14_3_um_filter_33_28]